MRCHHIHQITEAFVFPQINVAKDIKKWKSVHPHFQWVFSRCLIMPLPLMTGALDKLLQCSFKSMTQYYFMSVHTNSFSNSRQCESDVHSKAKSNQIKPSFSPVVPDIKTFCFSFICFACCCSFLQIVHHRGISPPTQASWWNAPVTQLMLHVSQFAFFDTAIQQKDIQADAHVFVYRVFFMLSPCLHI